MTTKQIIKTEPPVEKQPKKQPPKQWRNKWSSKKAAPFWGTVVRGPGEWVGRAIYPSSAAAEQNAEKRLAIMRKTLAPNGKSLAELFGLEYLGPVAHDGGGGE
jgi:hypothetical protein